MKLTYQPVFSLDEVVGEVTRVTNATAVDSVEGIMFSLNEGVIMNGVFADDYEPGLLNKIGRCVVGFLHFMQFPYSRSN